jgi:hypothetical protein
MLSFLNLILQHSMIYTIHLFLSQRGALLMITASSGMLNQMHQHVPLISELTRILGLRGICLSG